MRLSPAVILTWLLLGAAFSGAHAQSIPTQGTDETFDVATWNIEWFGSASNGPTNDDLQFENVVRIISESEIDLWAVQEIDDEDYFRMLVDELGAGWEATVSSGSNFQIGFIYKSDVVSLRQQTEILTQFEDDFAGRPPLLIEADVKLPHDTVRTTIITLHMKAFGDASSYDRRDRAATQLKNRLDFFYANDAVIVLGDWNDELAASIASGRPTPYAEFIADEDDYAFLTQPLDDAGVPTWCETTTCSFGSTFDHILITDELFNAYEEGSAARYEALITEVDRYTATTSDHLPVFARFRFSDGTGTKRENPAAAAEITLYPNPTRRKVTVRHARRGVEPVTIHLYDQLGRRVFSRTYAFSGTGTSATEIDVSGLAAGTYLVRLQSGIQTTTKPLIVIR